MKLHNISKMIFGCAILLGAASCVKEDNTLGFNVIPRTERYITRTAEIPIGKVKMAWADSLSGYSSLRMVLGSVTDPDFGICRRCCALNLVPVVDTLKWGKNFEFMGFHVCLVKDTLSFTRPSDENIIQNIRVYQLKDSLGSNVRYACDPSLRKSVFDGSPGISCGTPIYNGGDSLGFDLQKSYALSFVPQDVVAGKATKQVISSIAEYNREHRGIFICTDDPVVDRGRVNFFKVELGYDDNYLVTGAYAELKFRADYEDGRGQIDTSFLFCFGPTSFDKSSSFYAFNSCEHSTSALNGTYAGDEILIEGGTGLKPIIEAAYLREIAMNALRDTLEHYGYTGQNGRPTVDEAFRGRFSDGRASDRIIVNRATIILPYEYSPSDYQAIDKYPQLLNPTLRLSKKDTVTFAGLTDASISDENQGDIDRSNCRYCPDISHHMQQILSTNKEMTDSLTRENIWFMILAQETYTVASQSSSDADYYNQMAYLNYYNSMLGGYGGYGYGGYGYGGYGGYNNYDNYYSYYMMQAYYNSMSNNTSTTTANLLDLNRFYKGKLYGPSSAHGPVLKITYSFLGLQ